MLNSKQSHVLLLMAGLVGFNTTADALTVEELEAKMNARFEKLEQENQKLRTENAELKSRLTETTEQVETNKVAVETVADNYDNTEAVSRWFNKTTLGGYGELHYNHLSNDTREIDFHRFVLFFGHEFTDRLRFFSEIEVEHALSSSSSDGEVEVEQAFLEYDVTQQPHGILDSSQIRGGLFLIPVGILNETHEPPTFYGVERNDVESVIVPATWWAGGFGGTLNFNYGISVDLAVTSGLNLSGEGNSAWRIRSGRQKVSKARANDFAYTTRLKYTGIPGLEVAGTFQYQGDMGQEAVAGLGAGRLYEVHGIYTHAVGPGAATLKALWAKWDINGEAIDAADADNQYGWYLEPSYRFDTGILGDIGIYGRFEKVKGWRTSDRFRQWEGGLNWWPHQDIVVKFDYRYNNNSVEGSRDFEGFDLGLGYQF